MIARISLSMSEQQNLYAIVDPSPLRAENFERRIHLGDEKQAGTACRPKNGLSTQEPSGTNHEYKAALSRAPLSRAALRARQAPGKAHEVTVGIFYQELANTRVCDSHAIAPLVRLEQEGMSESNNFRRDCVAGRVVRTYRLCRIIVF